jgi:hypothetical protein
MSSTSVNKTMDPGSADGGDGTRRRRSPGGPRAAASSDHGGCVRFTPFDAFVLLCSIFTYIVDVALDVILAVTYLSDGYTWYGVITVALAFVPTLVVQVFSVRWHMIDEVMNRAYWIIHSMMLGVLHRSVKVKSFSSK